ncbi:hypothetical protein KUH03_30125 [Sphingobacterium sp. E70]|uniref:hypothetical protein n=1 Tax=Sphingobacterium sp. E70 TaxID=2853439 RepID=UPI00211B9BF5|nr:hypothetical protein [Sphingobacterium sp. E70]ULT23417.1 hypothetical protein KUH03_30125 [Sphingobacterium sp. E70]
MLPLPEHRDDRINLLAHESFHRIQPELGFKLNNANNNHLDEKDGRISLRLEFEALKKALASSDKKEIKNISVAPYILENSGISSSKKQLKMKICLSSTKELLSILE